MRQKKDKKIDRKIKKTKERKRVTNQRERKEKEKERKIDRIKEYIRGEGRYKDRENNTTYATFYIKLVLSNRYLNLDIMYNGITYMAYLVVLIIGIKLQIL